MPIAFEIQQGLPCVFTNLPNLLQGPDRNMILDKLICQNLGGSLLPLPGSDGPVPSAAPQLDDHPVIIHHFC